MNYRKEIDGLRALAIIPVVLYHAGLSFFKGGFVGVDVFFVISGYLITSIILSDVYDNRFSFSRFYERRLRRIFPALFVVCAACFVMGFAYIPPSDMQDFSKSLLRTFIFISNIYFYNHSGYFDQASELKPLLHTWSLSVEEQYYILFPPFVILFYKFIGKKYIGPSLVALTLVGLAMSQYLLITNPQASYYLIQSRGWEIMLGAVLATSLVNRKELPVMRNRIFNEFAAFAGVMLIIVSSVSLNNETMFPGVMALLPTVGAALVIAYAQQGTFTARMLQLKGLVLIGLMSYSLYLWHQPVLAMARIMFSRELYHFEIFLLLGLIFALAFISWRWVETPFRNRKNIGKTSFKVFIISGFLCVFAFGNWGAIDGIKSRFSKLYEAHPKLLGVERKAECVEDSLHSSKDLSICTFGDRSSASAVALWGDSHAEMLIGALDEKFKELHIKGVRIKTKDCGPIPSIQIEDYLYSMHEKRNNCAKKYEAAYEFIQKNAQSTIIGIRWTYHVYPVAGQVDSRYFDNLEGGVEPGKSRNLVILGANDHVYVDGDSKKTAIHHLFKNLSKGNQSIILVYPIPEVGWDVPRKTLMDLIMDKHESVEDITTSHAVYINRNRFVINALDGWENGNVYRIRSDEVFCKQSFGERCVAKTGEVSYYSDTNHLSYEGASLIVEKILAVFPR